MQRQVTGPSLSLCVFEHDQELAVQRELVDKKKGEKINK